MRGVAPSDHGASRRAVRVRVGVLALQGAFVEHENRLAELGVESIEVRQAEDLERPFDRLILPGGESTVQGKLLREQGMLEPLRQRIEAGMPVLGTCAGLILLARQVERANTSSNARSSWSEAADASGSSPSRYLEPPDPCNEHWLGTLSVTVRRNAYGRQLGSFHTTAPFLGVGEVPMTFIRAPYITRLGPGAQALAKVDGCIVAARAGNQIGVAFHPELDHDLRIHQLFLNL